MKIATMELGGERIPRHEHSTIKPFEIGLGWPFLLRHRQDQKLLTMHFVVFAAIPEPLFDPMTHLDMQVRRQAGNQNSSSYNKFHKSGRVGNPAVLPAPENLCLSMVATDPFRVKEDDEAAATR